MNHYDEIGVIDVAESVGRRILNCKIIGTDQDLIQLKKEGFTEAFISLGSVGRPYKRLELYELIKRLDFTLPVICDITANVSHYASISEGSFIGKNVIINADTVVGKCSILNTGCIVEHDCKIGDFTHIAPGAVLSGNVTIGRESHIGANSTVRQNCVVGNETIIGMGSVVVTDIGNNSIAFGNPCRKVEKQ